MEKSFSKPTFIAGIATALLAASFVTLLTFSNGNKSLHLDLCTENFRSEKLLAETLALDMGIAQFTKEMDQCKLDIHYLTNIKTFHRVNVKFIYFLFVFSTSVS